MSSPLHPSVAESHRAEFAAFPQQQDEELSPIASSSMSRSAPGALANIKYRDTAPREAQIELQSAKFPDGSRRKDTAVYKLVKKQVPVMEKKGDGTLTQKMDGGNPVFAEVSTYEFDGFKMPNAADNPPHSDSHMHPLDYIQKGPVWEKIIAMMDALGVRQTTLMPIPTSLVQMPSGDIVIQPDMLRAEIDRQKKGKGDSGASSSVVASARDDHNAHRSGCAPLDTYYVPKDIQDRVMQRNGGQPLTIKDFMGEDGKALIDEIVGRNEVYVDTEVNSHLMLELQKAGFDQATLDRLHPMITGLHIGDGRASDKLLKVLYLCKGFFIGVGEITLNKELIQLLFSSQKTQANLETNIEPLISLLEMAGIVGMPVVLHSDIDDLLKQIDESNPGKEGRAPAYAEGLKKLFTHPRVQNTIIFHAHGGGLGRFVQQGHEHVSRLSALLDECPNLNYDISWSWVAKQITGAENKEEWIAFLEKYSHRISFGSDTLAPMEDAAWGETLEIYKQDILTRLSPGARYNILNGTFEKNFVQQRKKVREFEDLVLTDEFYNEVLKNPKHPQPVTADAVRERYQAAIEARKAEATAAREAAEAAEAAAKRSKWFLRLPAIPGLSSSSRTQSNVIDERTPLIRGRTQSTQQEEV